MLSIFWHALPHRLVQVMDQERHFLMLLPPQGMEPGCDPERLTIRLSCGVSAEKTAAAVTAYQDDLLPTLIVIGPVLSSRPHHPKDLDSSPQLVLLRSKEGLRGFQGALFNSAHVVYL